MSDYTVASYLVDRLKELGIRHVFGVPGDYAFNVLNRLEADPDIEWVGGANELNGAISADGYARAHGIGAVLATSGPGVLGAAAGVAGAYAEHVPVVAIFGHPPTHIPGSPRETHHSLLNDFSAYERIYAEFTAAHTVLTEPDACSEIDRVLQTCWTEKLPVYIAVPKDIGRLASDPPAAPLELTVPRSDPAALDAFLADLVPMLDAAERPAMIIDHLVGRYAQTANVEALGDALGIPYATVFAGKSAGVDESKALYLGNYVGPVPGNPISERIDGADVLLRLALFETPTNVGSADCWRHRAHHVDLGIREARIGSRRYPGVSLLDVVDRLAGLVQRRWPHPDPQPARATFTATSAAQLTQDRVLAQLESYLRDDDLVILDQGTCSALNSVRLPARTHVVNQTTWGAIGYSVAAAVGTLLAAPDRRQIIIVGDGGFQLTAQELSTMLREGTAPIIIVLDNATMLIEDLSNPGYDPQRYNDVQAWDYAELPSTFAPKSASFAARVTTEGEFAAALEGAAAAHLEGQASLIDVVVGATDAPRLLLQIFSDLNPAAKIKV